MREEVCMQEQAGALWAPWLFSPSDIFTLSSQLTDTSFHSTLPTQIRQNQRAAPSGWMWISIT